MRKKEIELDDRFGEEFQGKYVFSEISWAKRSRIIQRHTKYHPISGQVVSSDYVAIQAETIWASLKQQPQTNPISLARLLSEEDGISIELGELFSQIVNRLCGMTADEQRFLSEPSEEENPIQASQHFGSAKSSVGPQNSSRGSQSKPSKSSS